MKKVRCGLHLTFPAHVIFAMDILRTRENGSQISRSEWVTMVVEEYIALRSDGTEDGYENFDKQ